jgi:peroxiredoxin
MVSSSSQKMPENWAGAKTGKSFKNISDTTGNISARFGSLHKMKNGGYYSDRTVFVLDKNGVIRYVDYDYDVKKDFDRLKKEIKKAKAH